MIDTHCHLDAGEFDADRDQVLARADAAGVRLIVVPAIERANWSRVCALAGTADVAGASPTSPGAPPVVYALGIHPLLVPRAQDADLEVLRETVRRLHGAPRFVGIGEIGLDHFVPGLDRDRQLHFFVEQLRIAREFDLPVILHVRKAVDTVARELRRLRPRGGIAHAFNGSAQQADAMIALGMKLGFGGACTFTRARNLRRLAASLPIEALVLETDSPDIAPEWRAPGRNEPGELPRIAGVVAALRGVDVSALADATTTNACAALGIREALAPRPSTRPHSTMRQ
ncbi:MAG: TatD family hydrolase [Lautropia sp.]